MGQPRPVFVYFRLSKHTLQFFTPNRYVKKCPSSILCRDSNWRPMEQESPPITTTPGLPPTFKCFKSTGFEFNWSNQKSYIQVRNCSIVPTFMQCNKYDHKYVFTVPPTYHYHFVNGCPLIPLNMSFHKCTYPDSIYEEKNGSSKHIYLLVT